MKVFYINNSYTGCAYVRSMMPALYNGWKTDITNLTDKTPNRKDIAHDVANSDVIVFHRPDDQERLEVAVKLKKAGKKIVYDNDDTYKVDDGNTLGKFYHKKNGMLDRFIRYADLITTTTEFLAEEYRELNKNVVVLPNCVDPNDWDTPLRNEGDKVRIGIFGSVANNGDSEHIKDLLIELGNRDDVQLVLFGLQKKTKLVKKLYKKEFEYWEKINIEWHPVVPMYDYFDKLNSLKLDFALIPRKDNYFNRCKSNIKYLEAGMLEIPVIAQSFSDKKSPYDYTIKHGKTGYLANTEDEFRKYAEKLIKDKKLRRQMGKNAYEDVVKNYNILNKFKDWEYAYNQIK
ncbi:MAG: Glycosyl transferases group 1 [Tenericutes bacterium ADurb.Bin239]|mgnify:CR=1 FL=1|nr:MAG: Glycosyl transferases group 1 [Tenericutes bacterium ADurb.Bin239]HNU95759.1 glycosyltransferase [Candidatus Paceibacterota bacterium]